MDGVEKEEDVAAKTSEYDRSTACETKDSGHGRGNKKSPKKRV